MKTSLQKTEITREHSKMIFDKIKSLEQSLKESRYNPPEDIANFLKELTGHLNKLIEIASKEIVNGDQGISIVNARINNKNLCLVFSDGKEIDVGRVMGEDGFDGDDANEKRIIDAVFAKIPEQQKIDEEGLIARIIKLLPKQEQVTAKEIINKIKDDKALSYKDLTDIPDIQKMFREYIEHIEAYISRPHPAVAGTNVISKMLDVDGSVAPQDTYVLTWNAQKQKYEPRPVSGGGTGLTKLEKTSGAIDDSNATFGFVQEPTYLIINNMWYDNNGGVYTWTWNGAEVVLNNVIGSGGVIWGFA